MFGCYHKPLPHLSISSRFRVDLELLRGDLLQYRTQSFLIQERFRDGILPQGRLALSRNNYLGRFLQGLVRRFHLI